MKSLVRSLAAGRREAAFSLIEIAFSLSIIGGVVLVMLGTLPVGLDAAKRATTSTIVTTILESLQPRLQGEPLTSPSGTVSFSPALFDEQGIYLPADASDAELARAVYRADLTLADWHDVPANTSALRLVTIAISWPVNGRTGELPPGVKPQTVVSYPVTTLTGTDWPEIARAYTADPVFVPKIGF